MDGSTDDERYGAGPDAVIILAGGRGRRLGGVDKAALDVRGRSLLRRAIDATGGCPVVVVGPARDLPSRVVAVQEDPPGGGPAAGVAAGFETVRALLADPGGTLDARALIAVLAVDHPGVTRATLSRIVAAVPAGRDTGAMLVRDGHRQHAVAVIPAGGLARALAMRPSWHDVALRALVDPVVAREVPAEGLEADDVDTPEDLARWRATGERGVGDGAGPPGG